MSNPGLLHTHTNDINTHTNNIYTYTYIHAHTHTHTYTHIHTHTHRFALLQPWVAATQPKEQRTTSEEWHERAAHDEQGPQRGPQRAAECHKELHTMSKECRVSNGHKLQVQPAPRGEASGKADGKEGRIERIKDGVKRHVDTRDTHSVHTHSVDASHSDTDSDTDADKPADLAEEEGECGEAPKAGKAREARDVARQDNLRAWGAEIEGLRQLGCQLSQSLFLSGLPRLCTCQPKPYTLHPTPYTLHPTPYTLHPTPYTLHPTPYTLYPKP